MIPKYIGMLKAYFYDIIRRVKKSF